MRATGERRRARLKLPTAAHTGRSMATRGRGTPSRGSAVGAGRVFVVDVVKGEMSKMRKKPCFFVPRQTSLRGANNAGVELTR
eukprot:CAMPEP_0170344624 /NCGR_PEP_ID=MMETSP0116_2-20130129/73519_1 /TAXON_ID=400756 /ORGANISM="Durinskia baltica, Strain CSIRO CS-38" /LENGTH=82 /DNA_ID=CAMNT_0010598341 /DNA_START=42 /DNA_END=290 /DNA_ORIENTATION=-